VTPSHLPRRAIVGAVLATALLGAGLAAFADDAPAGGCPAWTDPKGDSTTGQQGVPGSEDTNLDITAASLSSDAEMITATITSDGLGEASSDAGDEFNIGFTVAGSHITMYADRWAQGTFGGPVVPIDAGTAGFINDDDSNAPLGEATVSYDLKKKTVTIKGKVSELAKAAAKPVAGQPMTGLVAATYDIFADGLPVFQYDDAPTKLTLSAGVDCSGGGAPAPVPSASPSASPTPAPSPSATPVPGAPAPAGLPAAGCYAAKDPTGDAIVRPVNGLPGDPGAPNDPDLDVTALTLASDAKSLTAYIKVDKLGKPAYSDGHRFYVSFTFNKHNFTMAGSAFGNGEGALRDGLHGTGQVAATTQLAVDGVSSAIDPNRFVGAGTGFVDSGLKFTFDVKNSYVIAALPIADLEKYGKAPAAGATLTGVYASGNTDYLATAIVTDTVPDGATSSAPGKLTYAIGDNHCFAPPAPPLSSVGSIKAQYGDVAAVAAKLVDAAGAPVAGKPVTFTLDNSKASGTTGADGIAKAALLVKEKAGKRSLVITSGDTTTTVPFTVLLEKTVLKAVGGKAGATVTLTDDDRTPVAGQVITFTSGSKKVTARTNAKGVAKATGLPPGNLKVAYAGAAGMYTAASTTTRSS
jgi:hypothetical protein